MKNSILIIFATVFMLSCSNSNNDYYADEESYTATILTADDYKEEANGAYEQEDEMVLANKVAENSRTYNRKLIKEGNVSFETDDMQSAYTSIVALVKEVSGYISNEQIYNYGTSHQYDISVRLPVDEFDTFLHQLGDDAGGFQSKQVFVRDVTEEFVDIESRLKTKYELETSYLSLLKQAKSVSDVLNVERELGYVRADIESMEGRLRYLKDQVGMSTLHISFYQYKETKTNNFFSDMGNQFGNGWRALKTFILGIIAIWPFVLIVCIAVVFVIKWWKRRKNREQHS